MMRWDAENCIERVLYILLFMLAILPIVLVVGIMVALLPGSITVARVIFCALIVIAAVLLLGLERD